MKSIQAAELLVQCLESEDVTQVFAVPGEENLDLLEALRNSSIRLILTRHEQAAGFMAACQGRLTGQPGVVLSTLGPGATNLVTAAAYAELGAMPLVMITGQKPIKTSKQGHFQIVDVVDLMRPVTRYTRQVVSGTSIPARVREAFRRAEEERPGATHLELPEDVLREDVQERPMTPSRARRPVAEDKAVDEAVQAIEKARRPLLMIGAGANRKVTARMLRRFVDRFGIPFFTTQMGKGVVNETHHCWVGNAALSDGDFVHRAIDAADCIINVGHDVVEKPPFFMHEGRRTVIHINFSSAEVDGVYFPQLELVGDIGNAIWQLGEKVRPQDHWDFDFARRVRAGLDADLDDDGDYDAFPIHPRRVVHDVRAAMPDNGILALDNGLYKVWFARNYKASHPNTVLLDNALATMGAGLPVAMGARLVHPDRKILAVCGDGGFMMNSQELETAVRLDMDLVILVLRDDAYGMIRWKQKDMQLPDFGLSFGNPDFVRYAESYGALGHRVESTDALASVLSDCLASPGVHLIDCPVDYGDSQHQLFNDIPDRSKKLRLEP